MRDNIAYGIITGLLFFSLLVLFCVLMIRLYIKKIKNYTRLIYQKDLDYQKAINTAIIETQEQMLTNISQELHDDAGQQLTYINFFIENARLDSPQLSEVLDPVSDSVKILSNTIRDISHSLNNQVILQQDIVKAIEAEAYRLQKNSRITIKFNKDDGQKNLGTNEKIVVYRIFQEIINNALKHSDATEIYIEINSGPFRMMVRDNGKGFDTAGMKDRPGMGLSNIASRADMIDFRVAINSVSGKGTTVIISEK